MSDSFRLVVIAQEFPYPPNHGGRADTWRRLRALHALGCQVHLVCWCEEGGMPSEQEIAVVEGVVGGLRILVKRGGWRQHLRRLAHLLSGVPSHAAARMPRAAETAAVLAQLRAFAPDALLLEHPYGGGLARALCRALELPMFYRSHNIEFQYFASQAAAATSLRNRLAWRLACVHLERYEQGLIASAAISFDISADDLEFWKRRGMANGYWLPPLPEAAFHPLEPAGAGAAQASELLFLGNLNAPNNVRGVRWLIEQVMPLVWQQAPDAELTVAGSRPSQEVVDLVAGDRRLRLWPNVADAPAAMAAAQVLLNPVLSGSGVNVKTLDMLMTERPIVSSRQGVAGLPPALQSLCLVAQDAAGFAAHIVRSRSDAVIDHAARDAGRALFSVQAVGQAVAAMRAQIGRRQV